MKGYINGINWVNISPMKYWSFTNTTDPAKRAMAVKTAIFGGDYIGARKVDGYYQRLVKDEDGNCFMIARSTNVKGEVVDKIDWVPQIKAIMESWPNGTCVLGEIYIPGHEGSNNITTILGCLKEKAIERQKDMPLHYYLFDVMAYEGINLNKTKFIDRVKYIDKFNDEISPYLHLAKYFEGELLWTNLQELLAHGYEGIVLMRKDAIVYQGRTPARVSIKVKKELSETIDAVVLGANAPTRNYGGGEIQSWQFWENPITGERKKGSFYPEYWDGASIEPVTQAYFYNWAGSLIVGARLGDKIIPIGNVSGLTQEVLANWQKYKGAVMEITGMQIMDTNGHGIRHPKFVKWRPDLKAEDTDYERIFGTTNI